jgi:ABC-type transporter Mla subunit MlaD
VQVSRTQKLRLGLLIVSGFVILTVAFLFLWQPTPQLRLHTCLFRGDGLQDGARVTISGINVGHVEKVRVQPQDKACPVAVGMALSVKYELKVPADSLVDVSRDGLLGETYLDIDVRHAVLPAVKNGGLLPSRFPEQPLPSPGQTIEKAADMLKK